MNEIDLRDRLREIAADTIQSPRPLPPRVAERAHRGQLWTGLAVATLSLAVFGGALQLASASSNLVGPAPIAGGPDSGVVDPPDHAFSSGYSLSAEIIDDRICGFFELQERRFEEHLAEARICDPDPNAVLGLEIRQITMDTDPPTELVIVGGAVGSDVVRVEVELSDDKLPPQVLALVPFKDFDRKIIGGVFERKVMFGEDGRSSVVIRAFDAQDNLLFKRVLCESGTGSDSPCPNR